MEQKKKQNVRVYARSSRKASQVVSKASSSSYSYDLVVTSEL